MKNQAHDNKTSGQACVEFALVLPFLVLLLAGVYDFGCAIRANNAISNMSREGASMASRDTLVTPQDIMNSLAYTSQLGDMQTNGKMYITVVACNSQNQVSLQQYSWGSISNTTPVNTSTLGLTLVPNQTVYVVEVFYNYRSLFLSNANFFPQLHSKSIFQG